MPSRADKTTRTRGSTSRRRRMTVSNEAEGFAATAMRTSGSASSASSARRQGDVLGSAASSRAFPLRSSARAIEIRMLGAGSRARRSTIARTSPAHLTLNLTVMPEGGVSPRRKVPELAVALAKRSSGPTEPIGGERGSEQQLASAEGPTTGAGSTRTVVSTKPSASSSLGGGRLTSLAVGRPRTKRPGPRAAVGRAPENADLRPYAPATTSPNIESMGDAPLCTGTIIIHLGRMVTCTDPMCNAASSGIAAVLDQHCWFVSCAKTLGSECPICRPSFERFAPGRDAW